MDQLFFSMEAEITGGGKQDKIFEVYQTLTEGEVRISLIEMKGSEKVAMLVTDGNGGYRIERIFESTAEHVWIKEMDSLFGYDSFVLYHELIPEWDLDYLEADYDETDVFYYVVRDREILPAGERWEYTGDDTCKLYGGYAVDIDQDGRNELIVNSCTFHERWCSCFCYDMQDGVVMVTNLWELMPEAYQNAVTGTDIAYIPEKGCLEICRENWAGGSGKEDAQRELAWFGRELGGMLFEEIPVDLGNAAFWVYEQQLK